MDRGAVLTRHRWTGVAHPLGEVWSLKKSGRTMTCRLTNHPFGWELRMFIGEELYRSEVCKVEEKVFDTADAWKVEAKRKGWAEKA